MFMARTIPHFSSFLIVEQEVESRFRSIMQDLGSMIGGYPRVESGSGVFSEFGFFQFLSFSTSRKGCSQCQ